jgi:hypothetical protein
MSMLLHDTLCDIKAGAVLHVARRTCYNDKQAGAMTRSSQASGPSQAVVCGLGNLGGDLQSRKPQADCPRGCTCALFQGVKEGRLSGRQMQQPDRRLTRGFHAAEMTRNGLQ